MISGERGDRVTFQNRKIERDFSFRIKKHKSKMKMGKGEKKRHQEPFSHQEPLSPSRYNNSNLFKPVQTSSNLVKLHQTSSNFVKSRVQTFSPTEICKRRRRRGRGRRKGEKIARYASRCRVIALRVIEASRVASRKWRHFGRCGTAEPGSERERERASNNRAKG